MSKDSELPKIWLSSPYITGDEQKYITEAFESNWIAPIGRNIDQFEIEIANYLKAPSVVCLSSGTSAIHLALVILGVMRGDEVLCPSFTFCASANPIVYQGATPIFVDSESETWNICPVLLEQAIKDRIRKGKKPKALILVHIYGMPAKLNPILKICNEYEIPIIEDAAESMGSMYKEQMTATFGKIAALSFNGNKIITTSGGGALVSSPEIAKKAKFLSTQAREPVSHYEHKEIGYNYRMSNVLAGIGRGQLENLEKFIKKKRELFNFYFDLLSPYSIEVQKEESNVRSNRWLSTVTIDSVTPIALQKHMRSHNIEVRQLWKPLHLQPVYKDIPMYGGEISEGLFHKGICLASDLNIGNEEKYRIKKAITELFA